MEETVELIRTAGIRGSFISEKHTLDHFRENWLRDIFDSPGFRSIDENRKNGLYGKAHEKGKELFKRDDFWEIESDRLREINKVLRMAEQILCQ